MLILAYSAWSITTVLPANPWSDDSQLGIIIISVYSQSYCNIWAGFISNGSELKHQSRADVLHRLIIWHLEDISPPPLAYLAYLLFFISLHLLCIQQEHLKIKEFRSEMKLLTTVGSFASRPRTCSLFFCSFSICSSFFFLPPPCKQRKKHRDQEESSWKDTCSEAAGSHWTGEGRVTLKLKPNTPSLQGMDENEDQA